ncbi:aromatic ring-opening dioxygenase LigA [Streptomyces abyssalis]|uniref:Aromatic ring-opening dioxygenase LigA n=1 Tax=Streptomyces abyssalis TaxID=933944 RepID=A0A1E7JQE5_9ACTN|nr:hypothetical protein [Streptomyces abyssalis]OEU90476.1 aromatic ring-opening dioxygenase LigA [Streptomyces abyssalis]OEU95213.1 aromatic ring-opening dioxygenase LigA [Streptomyces abyssalis]OEV28654.1 aromatic ring-opening dioxygenase LigA [Streptomyces nanshensis]
MIKRGSLAAVAAGLLLAVAGCGNGAEGKAGASGSGSADAAQAGPPSRKLVKWVGAVCESTSALKTVRKDSAKDLKEIRKPEEPGPPAEHLAASYISRTPWPVEEAESDLKDLGSSGVPAADRLRDAWLKKLKNVVPELDEMSPADAFEDAEGSAADVDELIQSLTPPEPDLGALTKKDPRLATAHKRAKQCAPGWKPGEEETAKPAPDPTGPLPEAADGKDTGACSDGKCEVLVTSEADITANGLNVHVTADGDSVTFQSDGGYMRLGGQGGVAKFGDDVKVTVVAQNEDGAVLKFSIP